jgi:hypothetical protein
LLPESLGATASDREVVMFVFGVGGILWIILVVVLIVLIVGVLQGRR